MKIGHMSSPNQLERKQKREVLMVSLLRLHMPMAALMLCYLIRS